MMAKPKEFAHLIKNKFGSADNINQISEYFNIFIKVASKIHTVALQSVACMMLQVAANVD